MEVHRQPDEEDLSTPAELPAGPEARRARFRHLTLKLFRALTDGHPRLAFNVARGHAVFDEGRENYAPYTYSSEWRRARVRGADGTEYDRKLTPHLFEQHVRGVVDVAIEAPAMATRLTFDFDQPGLPKGASDEQRLELEMRHWAQFSDFWESIGGSPDKQPVLQRTPTRTNLHADLPLDRPYPAHVIREWAEYHVRKHGFRVEIFPSGKPLRAPVGRGMALLVPCNPGQAHDLQLEARHVVEVHQTLRDGSVKTCEHRHVLAYLSEYLERYEAARRPLCEWLPDAPAWDELANDGRVHFGPWGAYEKDDASASSERALIQHTEELEGRGLAPRPGSGSGSAPLSYPGSAGARKFPRGGVPSSRRSTPFPSTTVEPASAKVDSGPGLLQYGKRWRETIASLLEHGITEPGTRHDSVLKLTWHWASEGHPVQEILRRMEAWARAHDHQCRYIRERGLERFVRRARYDAKKYFQSHCAQLEPRRSAGLRPAAQLAPIDQDVFAKELPLGLRQDGLQLLGVLHAYADASGVVAGPVRLSGAMLCGVLGDRRVTIDGSRRRLHTVLVDELQRLGVLTLHRDYAAGSHGREYLCWYKFGSGRLPSRTAEGLLELGAREVQEGQLVAVASGEPGTHATVRLDDPRPGIVDRPRSWWRRMFARRAFTPGEFADAEEHRVLPFPSPARNPIEAAPAAPDLLERLGWRVGRVQSFSYAACFGQVGMEDGSLAFIHQTDIDEKGWRDLAIGEEVSFELIRTPRGLRALGLWRVRPERPGRHELAAPTEPLVPTAAEAFAPGEGPRRRPRESDETHRIRVAIFQAEQAGDLTEARRQFAQLYKQLRAS